MSEYNVSVIVSIESEDADASQELVEKEIKSANFPNIHIRHVGKGKLRNLAGIKVSLSMLNFLRECVIKNDWDIDDSGYDTTLEFVRGGGCYDGIKDENLKKEFDDLLKRVGEPTDIGSIFSAMNVDLY